MIWDEGNENTEVDEEIKLCCSQKLYMKNVIPKYDNEDLSSKTKPIRLLQLYKNIQLCEYRTSGCFI